MNELNDQNQPENQEPLIGDNVVKTPVVDRESPLHVKVEGYDGPLDLLLDLIKKQSEGYVGN